MRITDRKGICPSNYKSSQLFLNKYRMIDIIIMISAFAWGVVWAILLLFVFYPTMITMIILVVIIPIVMIGLVQPFPDYHNNLEYITLCIKYKMKPKTYSSLVRKKVKK